MKFESIKTEIKLDEIYQDGMTFDELSEAVEQWINEQEIIYYNRAMNYLIDNDASLTRSLEIAREMGYDTASLNSELLATLVYQEDLRDEWYEVQDEVQELFED